MNRYALWKYLVILIAFCIGGLYTLPNFFGEAPAVQVSAARASVKVDTATLGKVEESLKAANLTPTMMGLENNSLEARFETTEQQLQAKDAMQHALNPDAATPRMWWRSIAFPVHPAGCRPCVRPPCTWDWTCVVACTSCYRSDMQAALTKKLDALSGDVRSALREKSLRHNGITREQQNIQMVFRDEATADAAQSLMRDQFPDLLLTTSTQGDEVELSASLKP
jgi:preprotein translocase subunit SecD